jgi:hypothetical protein
LMTWTSKFGCLHNTVDSIPLDMMYIHKLWENM